MLYDYERDHLILSEGNKIFKINLTSNISTLIAGSNISNYSTSLVGCEGNTFTDIRSLTHYYQGGKVTGYLIADASCYCVRYIMADPPYTTSTVYGNCSNTTSNRALLYTPTLLATGVTNTKFIYALTDENYTARNYSLHTFTSHKLASSNTNVGVLVKETTLFFDYPPFAITYVNDTLIGSAFTLALFKVLYGTTNLIVIQQLSNSFTSMRSYPKGILMLGWHPFIYRRMLYFTKNLSNTNIYADNLTCQTYTEMGYDALQLPNGTVLYIRSEPFMLVLMSCGLSSFNPSDMILRITNQSTSTHSDSKTTSFSNTNDETSSFTSTTSNGKTSSFSNTDDETSTHSKTTSSNNIATSSISQDISNSNSKSKSDSISNQSCISRSTSMSRNQTKYKHLKTQTQSLVGTRSQSLITQSTTRDLSLSNITNTNVSKANTNVSKANTNVSKANTTIAPTKANIVNTSISAIDTAIQASEYALVGSIMMVSMLSTSSVVNGPKTLAVMMVLKGKCGDVRDLSFFENPFRVSFIAIGNLCVLIVVFVILSGIGFIFSKSKPKSLEDWDVLFKSYKVYSTLFVLWFSMTPATITGFTKYKSAWYDILSSVIGALIIISVLGLLIYGIPKVFKLKLNDDNNAEVNKSILVRSMSIKKSTEWFGVAYLVAIIDDYTNKKALFIDILTMLMIAFITLVNSCDVLAVATMIINIIYMWYIIMTQSIQPHMALTGNLVYSLGDTLCLLLSLMKIQSNVMTEVIIIVYCVFSITGTILTTIPMICELECTHRIIKEEPEYKPLEIPMIHI